MTIYMLDNGSGPKPLFVQDVPLGPYKLAKGPDCCCFQCLNAELRSWGLDGVSYPAYVRGILWCVGCGNGTYEVYRSVDCGAWSKVQTAGYSCTGIAEVHCDDPYGVGIAYDDYNVNGCDHTYHYIFKFISPLCDDVWTNVAGPIWRDHPDCAATGCDPPPPHP